MGLGGREGEREREGGGPEPAKWHMHRPSLFNFTFYDGNFQTHMKVKGIA